MPCVMTGRLARQPCAGCVHQALAWNICCAYAAALLFRHAYRSADQQAHCPPPPPPTHTHTLPPSPSPRPRHPATGVMLWRAEAHARMRCAAQPTGLTHGRVAGKARMQAAAGRFLPVHMPTTPGGEAAAVADALDLGPDRPSAHCECGSDTLRCAAHTPVHNELASQRKCCRTCVAYAVLGGWGEGSRAALKCRMLNIHTCCRHPLRIRQQSQLPCTSLALSAR